MIGVETAFFDPVRSGVLASSAYGTPPDLFVGVLMNIRTGVSVLPSAVIGCVTTVLIGILVNALTGVLISPVYAVVSGVKNTMTKEAHACCVSRVLIEQEN